MSHQIIPFNEKSLPLFTTHNLRRQLELKIIKYNATLYSTKQWVLEANFTGMQ